MHQKSYLTGIVKVTMHFGLRPNCVISSFSAKVWVLLAQGDQLQVTSALHVHLINVSETVSVRFSASLACLVTDILHGGSFRLLMITGLRKACNKPAADRLYNPIFYSPCYTVLFRLAHFTANSLLVQTVQTVMSYVVCCTIRRPAHPRLYQEL